MKLIEFNWQPTDRQLRQFGAISLVALPLVGWLWGVSTVAIAVLASVGLLIAALGYVIPKSIQPLFVFLMAIATPIGMVIGELAMIMIYFGMFVPLAVCFRLIGRDVLDRKIDRAAKTYWQPKKQPQSVASYYRQS